MKKQERLFDNTRLLERFAHPASILAFLFLFVLIHAEAPVALAQKPVTVVFVVSRSDAEAPQNNLDAVVIVDKGKFKPPYAEESETAQQKFASTYFAVGKKYRVTFGGGEVGTTTVKSHSVGCNNIHAIGSVETNSKIPAHLSGLATNSDLLGRKVVSRRAPTNEERAAVMKLVNQIYTARKTSPVLLRTLKTTNLTATDLDGDGRLELIGSFVIEAKTKARRDLFLIAEPHGNGYRAALLNFQSYKLPPEGFDSAMDFVDQLDIDGDGIGEVFAQQHGFDAYGYNVYKKLNGRWREVLRTIGDAC